MLHGTSDLFLEAVILDYDANFPVLILVMKAEALPFTTGQWWPVCMI